jgi:hypothetical protein
MLLIGGIGLGHRTVKVITTPPALRFITPDGAGAGTGVDWANAAQLSALSTMIAAAGPGGFVFIRRDPGDEYTQTTTITLSAFGEPGRPVNIVGVRGDMSAVPFGSTDGAIVGNRQEWTLLTTKPTLGGFTNTSAYGGNILFTFSNTAAYLTFSDLYLANFGNTLNFGGNTGSKGISFIRMDAYNVRSWIYSSETSSVRGMLVEDSRVVGFSKDSIRFRGTSIGWTIRRCLFDSNWQDGDSFATGLRCNEYAGYLLCEDVTVIHCIQSADFTGGFKNGDGISTEHSNHHITLRRFHAEDITDAGIDMKGRYVVLEDCVVIGCGWQYKIFFADQPGGAARLVRCQSIDPVAFTGDTRSMFHIWMGGVPAIVPPFIYNDGENFVHVIDFQGTGGPTGMTAFMIETEKKHMLFNNNGGVTLPSGGTLNNTPPASSEFLYNQPIF